MEDQKDIAPNDTAYTRWSCHSGLANLVQILSTPPAPSNGGPTNVFLGKPAMRSTGWLVMLLTKAGDVETNPGPTTARKQVWICDICHRQIQVKKQISIRCNRIEHWVHLRCAGIRLAQYTDSWTCHQHKEYTHYTHRPHKTQATQLLPPPLTLPTPPQPKHTPIPLSPCSSRIGKAQT